MQKRVVLVSAAVAALGLAATVSGFLAEATKSKAFVGYDGRRCVYQRTPALFFGVAAALLALAALALATAASGCFGRSGRYAYAPAGRLRSTVSKLSIIAWVLVAVAAAMFLYGAALNRGGTRGLSTSRRGRFYNRRYYYGCVVLRSGIFSAASILTAAASACAVAAYVYLQRPDEPGQFVAPGVAMGQPQWSQPYPPPGPAYPPPPPAMAYPYPAAPPPPYGGGYGAKQPAGPA